MAITGEAGELASELYWLKADESLRAALSQEKYEEIALEIADVQIYMLRLADVLGIDVLKSVRKKIEINESRF